jgi:biopolymer transport protein ExbD
MKIHLDSPGEEIQIQIIPLIDVIFCILTFFILAALQLTRQQAINIDLPRAVTATTQMRDMLVVTVNATGQTFVDRQVVDRSQLAQQLQAYRQKRPDGLLVLYASQTAFYNDVVQVLDLMRQVGGERVALATIPASSEQSPAATSSPIPSPTIDPTNLFGNPTPSVPYTPGQFQVPSTSGQPPAGQSAPIAPVPRTIP